MCKVRSRGMISREPGDTGLAVGALRLLQRRGGVAVLRQASESMLAPVSYTHLTLPTKA